MIEILKPGLETSIQDYPGRKGAFGMGFPPSGPVDSWSFRLANILVGNEAGQAALECQFIGPMVKFLKAYSIAICGCDMDARIDGIPLEPWRSINVKEGQILEMGSARIGARAYIAISGGIDTPPFLGSRSTFVLGNCGGLNGRAIQTGDILPIGKNEHIKYGQRCVKQAARPVYSRNSHLIEVCLGPNDDWINEETHQMFLSTDWKLSPKSNRVGFRLQGPNWKFTEKAVDKTAENGSDPSNIIDHGYPIGAINLCGQTPIILLNDTLTLGGFINPYTVPSSAFWKLAQARPNDTLRFKIITINEAQESVQKINNLCHENNIEQLTIDL